MRTAYEWETEISSDTVQENINRTETEIQRITNVTLKGNFKVEADRRYWEQKVSKLKAELGYYKSLLTLKGE
jgi:hypothetical protein